MEAKKTKRYYTYTLSKKRAKTYNSGDSPVVTHLSTNPPLPCLFTREQTGSEVFMEKWSYVKELVVDTFIF
jgi:hypothetical protein